MTKLESLKLENLFDLNLEIGNWKFEFVCDLGFVIWRLHPTFWFFYGKLLSGYLSGGIS